MKFVLGLPGIDIAIKDNSTFTSTSPADDVHTRQTELCPNICGTESTSGATALHFACMRGDWEIINLLLEMPVSHDVQDDSQRLPLEYFDLGRGNLEIFKAYHLASKAWRTRWRLLAKKGKEFIYMPDVFLSYPFFADMSVLCGAIREGDYDYCTE